MEHFQTILYVLSNALLTPVVISLLLLLAWSLATLGGFAREASHRRKSRSQDPAWNGATPDPSNAASQTFFSAASGYTGFFAIFRTRAESVQDQPRELRQILDELEIDMASRLSHLTLGARIAPMLGLMGTLIPMGPALIGLSDGAIDKLASSLIVAFSTTVIGLLVGGLCYAMLHARRHWYAHDLCRLDYICESACLLPEAP